MLCYNSGLVVNLPHALKHISFYESDLDKYVNIDERPVMGHKIQASSINMSRFTYY